MSQAQDILAKLTAHIGKSGPKPIDPPAPKADKLDELLNRIAKLSGKEEPPQTTSIERAISSRDNFVGKANVAEPPLIPVYTPRPAGEEFIPPEPKSFREAKVTESMVEELLLKYLLTRGDASGRDIAEQVKLPHTMLEPLLNTMKTEQWLYHRGAALMNDYVFGLTDKGRERARRYSQQCTYYGAAPVSLSDYIASIRAQSLDAQHPTADDLKHAFDDLLINERMLSRIGPAVNSGRGMFLYGPAGNGKTSIAERITKAFGEYIWIPRAINVEGEILRLFDPNAHTVCPLETASPLAESKRIDRRWIRIKRPTIVVGGELTLENLEVTFNRTTGVSEAPVQMKSNCGTLVIDDFGRQKMSVDQLLNRWIVPLEKRYDILNMASGKKIQVPFDQLIIFSTNLQPKDLVDEAFLRRIPYKIDVIDPTEAEFRQLFQIMAPKFGLEVREDALDYLIEKHYRAVRRPFRNCQPRDLLMQIRNYCRFLNRPIVMSQEMFDIAVENYFAVM